ncbi:protease HtpX [Chromobacterium subtsugae]|uniref:protease HtpX n=1 Tax=Chromobacterium subtsugae TaxID=251747 RepID=UPI0006415466|nr:protease HtpX [Chromobacterium subtsugae]
MKRVILLIATNIAVMLVLSVSVRLLGLDRFVTAGGLNLGMLLMFSAVLGFGGAFISLALSKTMAKWSTGARVITQPNGQTEAWLLATVRRLADRAGLPMPEVAIYEGEPNAFATGPSRANSLVAVSTGLLSGMTEEEVEAVLAHEIAHIRNGDMVTLTLIQGVVNTFVYFLARVVGYLVDSWLKRDEENAAAGTGIGYFITVIVCEIAFGILASVVVMYFSRQREFRADAGAAELLGSTRPMADALRRLGGIEADGLPQSLAASGIAGGRGLLGLFATHPSLEERIARLEGRA